DKAQISSVNDIHIRDINGDQHLDLIIAGNIYSMNPEAAPNDAGNGLVLYGRGDGEFEALSPSKSGFWAPLNVKALSSFRIQKEEYILVANNNDRLQLFSVSD